jgi:hypothetical protein
MMMSIRTLGAFALVAEALVAGVLWGLMWLDPSRGAWFLPPEVPPDLINTFLVADVTLFVVAPLAAGHAVFHRLPWARAALWFHAGGVAYAALWAAWQTITTGAGVVGLALLVPPALFVPWLAWRLPATDT